MKRYQLRLHRSDGNTLGHVARIWIVSKFPKALLAKGRKGTLSIQQEKLSLIKTNEFLNPPMENSIGAHIEQEMTPGIQSVSTSPRKDFEMPRARNRGSVNMLQVAQKQMEKSLDLEEEKETENGEESESGEKAVSEVKQEAGKRRKRNR